MTSRPARSPSRLMPPARRRPRVPATADQRPRPRF